MSNTKRAEYKFTVKEFEEGTPWIALEPLRNNIFPNGLLGFDLPKNINLEKAKDIADYLNKNLKQLSFTTFK